MLKYANRLLAAIYVIGWLAQTTSMIGEPSSCKPLTWYGAWMFVVVLAGAMWLGWCARKETEQA